jgi:hypothetical protein
MPQLLHFLKVDTHTKLTKEETTSPAATAGESSAPPKANMHNTHNNVSVFPDRCIKVLLFVL